MIDQNSYGPIQLCVECQHPLEKARTMNIGKAVCLKCQKDKQKERLLNIKNKRV